MAFQKLILLVTLVALSAGQDGVNFDEYVEYVKNYIEYTNSYQLPLDNSELYDHDESATSVVDHGTYDFIVIGAGDAGTTLTKRLTDNGKFNVLLLEAGSWDDNFTNIPAMGVFTPNSPFNWGYMTVPQENACQGMRNHQCSYPRGKALGGSHILSGMIYARGNKADYDTWAAKLGDQSWSYEALLPYFKGIEHDTTEDPLHTPEYHGSDGLLYINYSYPNSLNYEQIMEASAELGLLHTDINGASQVGIQKLPWTTKHNVRETGGNTYIKPILGRKNLQLELNAYVTEILIEGDTATGVRFIKDNQTHIAKAAKEVILSAGSINSPQILMLSGIGPKEELQQFDIEVKNDLPVGRYLTDHPCFIGLYIRVNQTYPNLTVAEYLERYLKGETPYTSLFGGEHIAFLNTRHPGQNPPNIEFISVNPPMSIPSQQFFNFDDETFQWISSFDPLTDFAMYLINIQPKSRGWVKLQSKSPRRFPLVNPGFLTDEDADDIQALYEGIQFIVKMANTEPMRSIDAKVFTNSPRCEHLKEISEAEYWYCAIKQHTNTIFHPTGTTRMGVSPLYSVVDSKLRVHRMKNLRVCDAGAMPEIVSGHPIAAIMVMGAKLGDMLNEEYST